MMIFGEESFRFQILLINLISLKREQILLESQQRDCDLPENLLMPLLANLCMPLLANFVYAKKFPEPGPRSGT